MLPRYEPGLSIVVPVFNEVGALPALHAQIREVMTGLGQPFDILFVNDGSTDGSRQLLDKLASDDPQVRVLHFVRNYGQTAAMAAGFRFATRELVITLDADLQNDPADIPLLLERLNEGYDVVCGWRKHRQDEGPRVFASQMANRIISYTSKVPLHDYGCTLRIYRREFLQDLPLYGEMHRFIPIYVTWAGARLCEMPVRHHPRTTGVSKYGMIRIFKVLLDLITVKFLRDFYVTPIYFFGLFGISLSAMGIVSILAALFMRFHYGTYLHKNPFIIFSVMFFIMSLMMLMMGVIAEILIRMSFEIQKKAPYKVAVARNLDVEAVAAAEAQVASGLERLSRHG